MHCKPKNPSHRWSAVADLHTNTCNKTDIQQKIKATSFPRCVMLSEACIFPPNMFFNSASEQSDMRRQYSQTNSSPSGRTSDSANSLDHSKISEALITLVEPAGLLDYPQHCLDAFNAIPRRRNLQPMVLRDYRRWAYLWSHITSPATRRSLLGSLVLSFFGFFGWLSSYCFASISLISC
jgi:hypothetical protein